MKAATIKILNHINTQFYERNAQSFSATRTHGWNGWERLAPMIVHDIQASEQPFKVADIAAGNLRFFSFLKDISSAHMPRIEYRAFDSCAPLEHFAHMSENEKRTVQWSEIDIVEALSLGASLEGSFGKDAHNLVASFGFIHHIPTRDARVAFLRALVESVSPGGAVVVSFWQFLNDERLRAKAQEVTEKAHDTLRNIEIDGCSYGFDFADLESDDYLLGWQGNVVALGSVRYCHHFSDQEIASYVEQLDGVVVEDMFTADGKRNNLNVYLVLRKL